MGGIIGLLFNGFFATHKIIGLDDVNTSTIGGWLDGNWKQLYIQFAYVCATCTYTFVVTAIVAYLMNMIPGLELRATEEAEALGMDEYQVRLLSQGPTKAPFISPPLCIVRRSGSSQTTISK